VNREVLDTNAYIAQAQPRCVVVIENVLGAGDRSKTSNEPLARERNAHRLSSDTVR
jgi:hypothetical protein